MTDAEKKPITVGLVMPISSIDGCTADHWVDVMAILTEAVTAIPDHDFIVKLVSDSDDVGVIQKRIVQNLYNSDIVICDVSCKNPNVMFELGMRLAFDKPAIIVKDDVTKYTFDTGIIDHITYPRDLRFQKIVEFKQTLARKIVTTYEASLTDPNHSTFLKNFGEFKAVSFKETNVTPDRLMLEILYDLQADVAAIKHERRYAASTVPPPPRRLKTDEILNEIDSIVIKYLDQNGISQSEVDRVNMDELTHYVNDHFRRIYGKRIDPAMQKQAVQIVIDHYKKAD